MSHSDGTDGPAPSAPRPPLGRLLGTHLLVGLLVLLAGAGAVASAPADGWGLLLAAEVVALLAGAWLVLLLGTLLPATPARRGRLVVAPGPEGVVLPGSRALTRSLLGLLALSLLVPLTLLGSWAARGTLEGSTLAVVASVLLLPLGLPVLVQVLRGRVRVPALVLDDDAVTSRTWRGASSIAWSDLAEVRLVADPGRRLVLRASDARVRHTASTAGSSAGAASVGGPVVGRDEVSVPVAFMASDAGRVADLLESCRTDPRRRGEVLAQARGGVVSPSSQSSKKDRRS